MAVNVPEIGDIVFWRWGAGVTQGTVQDIIYDRAEIVSKGKYIVRNGTKANPAVIIDHKSGNPVIKLASELLDNQ